MAEKAPQPSCCFPQLHSCGPWAQSQQQSTCVCGWGCWVGCCHLPQRRGRRLLPKLLMSFPRLAATSHWVLLSFHPVLPCLHNWLRHYTACPPCPAFSAPASLSLFVPISCFPAKSLLRWGWKCFEAETPSLHSCLFCFADLFHT